MRRNDEFETSKISRVLNAPSRAIRKLWNRFHDDSIRLQQTPLQTAISILTLPFRLLFNFGIFMVFAWTTSRSNRAFLRGLPAVIVLGGFGAVIWLSFFIINHSAQVDRTEGYAAMHLEVNPDHPEYADIFCERLVFLLPEDSRAKLNLGNSKMRLDDNFLAMQIFEYLAPLEDANGNGRLDPGEDINHDGVISNGYNSAHILLGRLLQFDQVKDSDLSKDERLELAAKHYELALAKDRDEEGADDAADEGANRETEDEIGKLDKNDLLALKGIADIRKEQGRTAEAAASLERMFDGQIVGTVIQVNSVPDLLDLQKELGRIDEARNLARQMGDQLEKYARKNSENIAIWLSLFRCEMFLAQNPPSSAGGGGRDRRRGSDFRNVDSKFQLAKSLIKSNEGKKRINVAFAAVLVQISDQFADMSNRWQFERKLDLLCRSVKVSPTNPEVYKRLLFFANPDTAEQIEWLRDFYFNKSLKMAGNVKGIRKSDEGYTAAIVHTLVGVIELAQGEFANAQSTWDVANRRKPGLAPLVINSLIEVSMAEDQPPLENLGEMLAVANELFPRDLRLRITQASYFRKHGRLDEAIKLLEDVIADLANNANANVILTLHQRLIRLYEETGDERKATEQRRRLDSFIGNLKISESEKKRLQSDLKTIE